MNEKAQTTIDFILAVLIFISAITGAIIVSQDILDNRIDTQTDHRLEADRVTNAIVTTHLSAEDPNTLSKYCTVQYFDKYQDGELNDPKTVNCQTPLNRSSIQASVGIPDTRNLNVTIYEFGTRSKAELDETVLTAGQTKSGESGSIGYRVISINDQRYIIEVKVW